MIARCLAQTYEYSERLRNDKILFEFSKNLTSDVGLILPVKINLFLKNKNIGLDIFESEVIAGNENYFNEKININSYLLKNYDIKEELHFFFLREFKKKIASKHKYVKQYLQAILLHEIAHIVDREFDTFGQLSQQRSFLKIFGWNADNLKNVISSRRNFLSVRSPDPYEYTEPKETFAVNFEFYMLDPDYKCREPSKFDWFRMTFKHEPYPDHICEKQNLVMMTSNLFDSPELKELFSTIDLERIYQVHYLWAGKGEQAISKFGHATLRLVICKKGRPKGPECIKDLSQHIVINFAAAMEDQSINLFYGLTNKYPLIVSFQRLSDVVKNYTYIENREVFSLPLALNTIEIQKLVQDLIEAHWNYEGRYSFFTSNCATETLFFLKKSLVLRKEIQNISTNRPDELFFNLKNVFLDSKKIFADLTFAETNGYYFSSKRNAYEILFRKLKYILHMIPESISFDEYLGMDALDRRRFFNKDNGSLSTIHRNNSLSYFKFLESFKSFSLAAELRNDVRNKLFEGNANNIDMKTSKNLNIKKLTLLYKDFLTYRFSIRNPSYLIKNRYGYGIPLLSELKELNSNSEILKIINTIASNLGHIQGLEKMFADEDIFKELTETENNLKLLKGSN